MRNYSILSILFFNLLIILNSACNHENISISDPSQTPINAKPNPLKLTWTAFKFSNRTALNGTFDDIKITQQIPPGNDPADILNGLEFDINTGSVNTGMEFRDNNIIQFFFNYLLEGEHIKGSITATDSEREQHHCTIHLSMNGATHEVTTSYSILDKTLLLEGTLDLANWNTQSSLDMLNSHVAAYHTGSDGVNKLWSDMKFRVEYLVE